MAATGKQPPRIRCLLAADKVQPPNQLPPSATTEQTALCVGSPGDYQLGQRSKA